MLKTTHLLLLATLLPALWSAPCRADNGHGVIPVATTQKIEAGDTPRQILDKAVRVVPSARQMAALRNEFIAFVHFGPNTFTCKEWGNGMEDPKVFDLKTLNTDQWCREMKAAEMKMVILTVKHHDGFVLWQSRYTRHGIMSTSFRDGRGDVLRDLSASCRKYGLKLGIYLSPADLHQIESPDGLYGNGSEQRLRTIPREVEGRPFAPHTKMQFMLDDYNEYFMNQLYELLTEYGEIHEVWFDGAHPKRKGNQQYNYTAWRTLIRRLAPQAVIFGREDVRWCGNEAGATRTTEWNVIPYRSNPDTMTRFSDLTDRDLGSRERLYEANYLHYQQAETDTSIREGWFYRDDTRQGVRSADDVFDIYERSVGGNATFLLNIPPNRDGRLSSRDVETLREVGRRIRATYHTQLLDSVAYPPQLKDRNDSTYVVLTPDHPTVDLRFPAPILFNRIVLQEAVATHSERVERFAIDALTDGEWHEIGSATNIGYKRIVRTPEVRAEGLRFRLTEARADTVALATLTVHFYKPHAPRLSAAQDREGYVTLTAHKPRFKWHPNTENDMRILSTGYTIHYTTDGSTPTRESSRYTAPFRCDGEMLRAVAYSGNRRGTELREQTSYAKHQWTVEAATDAVRHSRAEYAIDGDPETVWRSDEADSPASHRLVIDLGRSTLVSGFAYTPQTEDDGGMIEKGRVEWSDNNRKWEKGQSFEFGNLINDPSKRYIYLPTPVRTRYIRIAVEATAAGSRHAAIAEFDVF